MAARLSLFVYAMLIVHCLTSINEAGTNNLVKKTSSSNDLSNEQAAAITVSEDHEHTSALKKLLAEAEKIKKGLQSEYEHIKEVLGDKPIQNWLFEHEMEWIEGLMSAYIGGATANIRDCFDQKLAAYLRVFDVNTQAATVQLEALHEEENAEPASKPKKFLISLSGQREHLVQIYNALKHNLGHAKDAIVSGMREFTAKISAKIKKWMQHLADKVFNFIATAFRKILVAVYNKEKNHLETSFNLHHHQPYVYEEIPDPHEEDDRFKTVHKVAHWLEAKAFGISVTGLNGLMGFVLKEVRSILNKRYESVVTNFKESHHGTLVHWMEYYHVDDHLHNLFDGILHSALNGAIRVFNHLKASIARGKYIRYNSQRLNMKYFQKKEKNEMDKIRKKKTGGCPGRLCGRERAENNNAVIVSPCGDEANNHFEIKTNEDDNSDFVDEEHQELVQEMTKEGLDAQDSRFDAANFDLTE